jgi:hypothetical protein
MRLLNTVTSNQSYDYTSEQLLFLIGLNNGSDTISWIDYADNQGLMLNLFLMGQVSASATVTIKIGTRIYGSFVYPTKIVEIMASSNGIWQANIENIFYCNNPGASNLRFEVIVSSSNSADTARPITALLYDATITDINGRVDVGLINGAVPQQVIDTANGDGSPIITQNGAVRSGGGSRGFIG